MLGSPRIVAIDDQDDHLAGLTNGLSQNGIACLQIHFTGDPTGIKPVRMYASSSRISTS